VKTQGASEDALQVHLVLDAQFCSFILLSDFHVPCTKVAVHVFNNRIHSVKWIIFEGIQLRRLCGVYVNMSSVLDQFRKSTISL